MTRAELKRLGTQDSVFTAQYLYLFAWPSPKGYHCKVGITRNPLQRFRAYVKQIRDTLDDVIKCLVFCKLDNNAVQKEKTIWNHFIRPWNDNKGEYFDVLDWSEVELVKAYIKGRINDYEFANELLWAAQLC